MKPDSDNTLLRFSELSQHKLDPTVASLLPVDFCLDRHVIILEKPSSDTSKPILIGMLNTKNLPLTSELEVRLDRKVRPIQLNAFEINRALAEIYGITFIEETPAEIQLSFNTKIDFSEDRNPSLILNDLLSTALRRRATDVHMENYEAEVALRFRVDGTLYPITTPLSPDNIGKVISRLKILCNLDHVEKRRAQDGRFTALYEEKGVNRKVDFRLSIVPGVHGQDAVIRILDPNRFILDLDKLGMPKPILNSYKKLVNYPNGLLLTTGPTGSGKTSTLYASVQSLIKKNVKIMTVEDPVEYEFSKVNQKNVDAFMDFPDYIRAFLRQNPDVILVGEIRDIDTAEIAMRAATTGHLVMSTLHTRDAIGTIARLRNLEISDDYIASVFIGAIGQRLVRKLCLNCRVEAPAPSELTPLFYATPPKGPFFLGQGCNECDGRGYRGMIGIYELFFPNETISTAIGQGVPVGELRKLAFEHGFQPLVEDALLKVHAGETTLEEIAKRIGPKFPHAG
ncbi:MAG: GspE/PulE family protein [Planctomycetota bacterium]|nr:GspE/PulE family protein [Planctomycetota bacterium]